jgi:hypothetical protein
LLGAAGVAAKGGSPGYHTFTHQRSSVYHACGAVSSRRPFARTARTCSAQASYFARAEASR